MSIVLIIADRADERQVSISRGLQLAAKMGWGAQVVGFAYENLDELKAAGVDPQDTKKKLLAKRKTDVQAEVDKFRGDVRTAVTVVWQKAIHLWIDQQCERKDYAAVIKTGHRTEHFLYTSTDWHLLRECSAPVMIAAEKKWRATKPIVAAVDLSSKSRAVQQLNDEVVATAKLFAEKLDTELYLIHALHIPAVLRELDLVDEYSHVKKMKKDLQPRVLKLAQTHGLPLSAIKLKNGPVDKVITSESARLKAQLLIMGTVGRKGMKRQLLGNTAEKVLARLRTDVLAIKP